MKNINKLFTETVWSVAYRKVSDIVDNAQIHNYKLIKNRFGKWNADPFLFENNNETFLFVETMDRSISKAHIECINLSKYGKNGKKSSVVLKEKFHLSYPCIFRYNGNIFMIPETSEDDSICIYKSINFPNEWAVYSKVMKGKFVDSTFFLFNNRPGIITYSELDKNICLYLELSEDLITVVRTKELSVYDEKRGRPAGSLIIGDSITRPTQNSIKYYGQGIDYYKVNLTNFTEVFSHSLDIENIRVKGLRKKIKGVHTINMSKKYEVIDVQYTKLYIFRPFMLMMKKFKLFGYKFYEKSK